MDWQELAKQYLAPAAFALGLAVVGMLARAGKQRAQQIKQPIVRDLVLSIIIAVEKIAAGELSGAQKKALAVEQIEEKVRAIGVKPQVAVDMIDPLVAENSAYLEKIAARARERLAVDNECGC